MSLYEELRGLFKPPIAPEPGAFRRGSWNLHTLGAVSYHVRAQVD